MGSRVFGPSSNLNSFQGRLLFLLRNRGDSGVTNTTELGNWINDAYTYLCHPSVHHFREVQDIETVTLASGTNSYSIATLNSKTVVAVRWVTFVDSTSFTATVRRQKLLPRDIRWFEERTHPASSEPRHYTIDGSTLYVSGVPGANQASKLLRVGFYREPAVLTGTDVTVLPRYWDRVLLKFAQGFAESDLGYRDMALETLEHAQTLANNAQDENQMESEDTDFQTEFLVAGAGGR